MVVYILVFDVLANYKKHSIFNLTLLFPFTLAIALSLFSFKTEHLLCYSSFFFLGTLFMSPDSDVADKVKLLSLRGILTLPFWFYSKIFRHRGMSHWVIIGTLTRILWLLLLFTMGYICIYHRCFTLVDILAFYQLHKEWIYSAALGLCVADIGHLLLDYPK